MQNLIGVDMLGQIEMQEIMQFMNYGEILECVWNAQGPFVYMKSRAPLDFGRPFAGQISRSPESFLIIGGRD